MQLKVKNNLFTLLPQKAIWWEEKKTLLLSDLHIGKITHFRNAGIAVPYAAAEENFIRLDQIMSSYPVNRIIFIGDLFHSNINSEWNQFCSWREKYSSVEMILVAGNHDCSHLNYCKEIQLKIVEKEFLDNNFTFAHHPKKKFNEKEYVISGHVHPVIRLQGKGRQKLKFPCFYFGAQQAILPSFGTFTGGYVIDSKNDDTIVAIVNDTLVKIC